jgi:hypothetical protein
MNAAMARNRVNSISPSRSGSSLAMVADWWRLRHQSTE